MGLIIGRRERQRRCASTNSSALDIVSASRVIAAQRAKLSKGDAAAAGRNFLEEDIVRRVAVDLVERTLQVQLAAIGDKIGDPSIT